MIARRSVLLLIVLGLSSVNASAEAPCEAVEQRVVTLRQGIEALLPPGAALVRLVPASPIDTSRSDPCPSLKMEATITTRRNAEAHALAESLRGDSGIEAVEIALTEIDPAGVVRTRLEIRLR